VSVSLSIQQILELIPSHVVASPWLSIPAPTQPYTHSTTLGLAGANSVSFIYQDKYIPEAMACGGGIVLATPKLGQTLATHWEQKSKVAPYVCVVSDNPYIHFIKVSNLFLDIPVVFPTHNLAYIDPTAQLHPSVSIAPFVYIGPDAVVGAGTVLYNGVSIGNGVVVGTNCTLYPNVVLQPGVVLGNHVIIQPGAVLGGDGFGFLPYQDTIVKIPHVGGVQIQDHVEIGANTTIDKGTLSNTVVQNYSKIDNLVAVGHNVSVGPANMICAQVGIAGSTTTGSQVTIGGQAGINGHIHIGDGAQIGPQSGVQATLDPKSKVFGSPCKPFMDYMKEQAYLSYLTKNRKKIDTA
jgi:UDP-3-O-[3-hydroxymyristoyl] glucosamine N-acyltransferase